MNNMMSCFIFAKYDYRHLVCILSDVFASHFHRYFEKNSNLTRLLLPHNLSLSRLWASSFFLYFNFFSIKRPLILSDCLLFLEIVQSLSIFCSLLPELLRCYLPIHFIRHQLLVDNSQNPPKLQPLSVILCKRSTFGSEK